MFAKYFVGIKPQTNEFHIIHKEGCPFLPEDSKRIYLGNFQMPKDAKWEGKKYFKRSSNCRFCSKENHSHESENIHCVQTIAEILLSIENLKPNLASGFQYCIN
jgi:hypothetical protein